MSTRNGKNGTPSTNGRNGKGQFAKGHPGGPGNPQAKALSAFRTKWLEVAKAEHVGEAYQWLYEAWHDDDNKFPPAVRLQALERFLDRTIGKPKESIEVSGDIDADEVRADVLAWIRDGGRN